MSSKPEAESALIDAITHAANQATGGKRQEAVEWSVAARNLALAYESITRVRRTP